MIASKTEYRKAREELDYLTDWLARLDSEEVAERKALTAASVRRMISRVKEEIAEYDAASASTGPSPENSAPPDDAPIERPDKDRNSDLPE